MADNNKINLTKEDIQAITQELRNQQDQHASAHAHKSGENMQQSDKAKKAGACNSQPHHEGAKNIVIIGLLTFWAVVFGVLLAKLMPYI